MLPLSPGFERSSSLRAEHLRQTPSAGRSGSPGEGTWPWTRSGSTRPGVYPQPGGAGACTWSAGPSSRTVLAVPGTRCRAVGVGAVRLGGQRAAQGLSSLALWPPDHLFLQRGFCQSPSALSYSSAELAGSGRLSHSFPSLLVPPAQPHSARSPGPGLRERDRGWAAGTCARECFGRRLCSPWRPLRSVNLVVTRSQSQHTGSLCASPASRAFPVEFSRNVASKGSELLKIESHSSPEKYDTRGLPAGLLKRVRPRQVGIPREGLDAQWGMPNCHI